MGTGINLFKTLFPSYYPYTANTLMSAKPTGKKIVGKNQYNGSQSIVLSGEGMTEKQSCILISGSYTLSLTSTTTIAFALYTYDENDTLLESYSSLGSTVGRTYLNFTVTKPCAKIAWYINASTTINDIMVEYGSTMTEYEPYSETTIVYSGNELRGILKVGTDGLYADGDIDDGSGRTAVRYEERAYQSGDESLTDAITDGTNTVVKRASPTTAISTAWSNPIRAAAGGTEEFTDIRTIKMPTGHDTIYSKKTDYRYWG